MVRVKIEWTLEARLDLVEILEFYLQRNGNSIYSKKLNSRINGSVKLLVKNPFLGKQTEDPAIRVLITGDYQIIYEVFEKLILIVMIWDCRKDPADKVIDLRKR
jgi:plasmid stabilization system protein ParE